MGLLLYNTLTKKKETFKPIQPPYVRMYCCGPTVYGLLHIGNFRGAVIYNCLREWLEHLGFKVLYFYNLTDVDDKIIKKAKDEGMTSQQISQKYIQEFFSDFKELKLKPHSGNPRATEYIDKMIQLIKKLIDCQMAYEIKGNVFYKVRNFSSYGRLSHRNIDDLYADDQTTDMSFKKDALDFSLWKRSKEGEPNWDSPWGKGRPGWHIECTTMVHHCLGEQIDIHGGGVDLIFPHHENEIAQSEACTKSVFVKYWIHHNMFELKGKKISKSAGNIQTMKSFLKEYGGEVFKYLVFSSHYRSVSEISKNTIYHSVAGLYRIYQALSEAQQMIQSSPDAKNVPSSSDHLNALRKARSEIQEAFNDDLNTPKVLSICFSLVRFFNESIVPKPCPYFAQLFLNFFKEYGKILSLFQEAPAAFLTHLDDILLREIKYSREDIERLIQERNQARLLRDFQKADQIRDALNDQGVEIQDGKNASKWRMQASFFIQK